MLALKSFDGPASQTDLVKITGLARQVRPTLDYQWSDKYIDLIAQVDTDKTYLGEEFSSEQLIRVKTLEGQILWTLKSYVEVLFPGV